MDKAGYPYFICGNWILKFSRLSVAEAKAKFCEFHYSEWHIIKTYSNSQTVTVNKDRDMCEHAVIVAYIEFNKTNTNQLCDQAQREVSDGLGYCLKRTAYKFVLHSDLPKLRENKPKFNVEFFSCFISRCVRNLVLTNCVVNWFTFI